MNNGFRSRGIRLIKDLPNTSATQIATSKIYYDADRLLLRQPELQQYIDNDILSYFEHSIDEYGNIDTFNFHLNFNNICDSLYYGLSPRILKLIKSMPVIFDATFLNYTIGYRLVDDQVIGRTFYFYPTIPKENRIGIKGITDKEVIIQYINNFIEYLGIDNAEAKSEIQSFSHLIYKFKGIGISVFNNCKIGYKIYGKVYSYDIYEYVSYKVSLGVKQYNEYGEVALVAQRIDNELVSGYNLYYLK